MRGSLPQMILVRGGRGLCGATNNNSCAPPESAGPHGAVILAMHRFLPRRCAPFSSPSQKVHWCTRYWCKVALHLILGRWLIGKGAQESFPGAQGAVELLMGRCTMSIGCTNLKGARSWLPSKLCTRILAQGRLRAVRRGGAQISLHQGGESQVHHNSYPRVHQVFLLRVCRCLCRCLCRCHRVHQFH